MTPISLPAALADLHPGDHLCALYETAAELRPLVRAWLRLGLEQHQKVIYLADSAAVEDAWSDLRADGVDANACLESGQLAWRAAGDVYLRDGRFDPAQMVAWLRAQIEQALADGYAALRLTGDMTWACGDRPGTDRLLEYEACLSQSFAGAACLALCLYDRRRFEAQTLLHVLLAHRRVAIGTEIFFNPNASSPEAIVKQSPAEAMLAAHLQGLVQRKQDEAALQQSLANLQAIFEASQEAFLLIDHNRKIITFNPAAQDQALAIFGRTMQAGDSIYQYLFPELAATFDEHFARALGGEQVRADRQFPAAALAQAWFEFQASPVRNAAGSVTGILLVIRDITERKQLEEATRKSESRLRLAAHLAGMGIWDWDIATDKVTWNEEMFRLYGIQPQAFTGKGTDSLEFTHPDDRQTQRDIIRAAFEKAAQAQGDAGETDYPVPDPKELRILRPDGSERIMRSDAVPLVGANGEPVELLGISLDITDQKRAEARLAQSTFDLNQAQHYSHVGSWVWYIQTNRLEWSDEMYRIFGIARETFSGDLVTVIASAIHPDDRAAVEQSNAAVISDRKPTPLEYRIVWPDGTVHWVWAEAGELILDELSQAVLLKGYVQDITARKQAEAALRESENRFQQVVASIPEHIYVSEIRGVNQAVNVYLSPQVEKLTGYRQQRFIDDWNYWLDTVVHPADRAAARAQTARLLAGQAGALEYRLQRADGQVIWVHDSARVETPPAGRPTIYGVIMDITERKRLEQALRDERASLARQVDEQTAELRVANAELLRAGRLKDEFLANMSHELRTPLTAILGLAEALQLGTYGPLVNKQVEMLQVVRQSGEHLLQLITDILDLSKIEAGKAELQLAPAAVAEVCEVSLQFIKQTAQRRHLRVVFSLDSQVRLLVIDSRRLKQMLVNLLSNAVKFTPEGGQVGLKVAGDEAAGEVRFTVWDTGIGISVEKQALLFRSFVQLDGSLTRKYEGTGLGLVLTRRLAELHGGRVEMASPGPGQGSRFTITLPWRSAETPSPLPAERAPTVRTLTLPSGQPASILVVDDNEATLTVLGDYLGTLSAHVVTARDGRAALAQAQAAPPDLILMDIQMPDMDGLEAISRLKAAPLTARAPIIALTALAMPTDRERCLAAGADDFLTKPVNLNELVQHIHRLLARGARD